MADATEQGNTDIGSGLLRELAAAHGVGTMFRGWDGAERSVPDGTLRGVLTALGVPAGGPDEMQRSLHETRLGPWRRLLPPVVVGRQGQETLVNVHVPHGRQVRVWIEAEDGSRHEAAQRDNWDQPVDVDGVLTGRATFATPADLPLGWHTLFADAEGAPARCPLVVTPRRLGTTEALAGRRNWGLTAQLYSVRSARSWGIGDLADLADLATVSGQEGAGFVLVNPLHAAEPRPPVEDSPYLPTTRRFVNPLYLRVEEIPEFGYLDPAGRAEVQQLAEQQRSANSSAGLLDRNSSYAAKLAALELVFAVPRGPDRTRSFTDFCAEQGQGLDDFALWCALAEELPPGAPEWTTAASAPDTAYCTEQRALLADRIDFHRWLQWCCDRQLEAAQGSARESGMEIGVIHDLAVGVKRGGADAWSLAGVLARDVTVGAPPDVFNQQGQDWTQPPWHPGRLAESGYAAYRDMLRTVLRHAGGIRVDHILGLFRLWWIPAGAGPEQGTYVYYDHEALIGILALEAQRAGAIVIGEDLGVFEPWVRDYLAERGIFGTSILWFEHDADGPIPPERYRQQCLTSVNTHDLPPTAGYLAGEHVTLRESLGLLQRPVDEEHAEAAAEQEAVLAVVRDRGLLPAAGSPDTARDVPATVEALYAFTALTPSSLLGVALVDAVGETRTQNQPGTGNLQYPNWCIPLAGPTGPVLLDELPNHPGFCSLARTVRTALHAGAPAGKTPSIE
ncbi:4-alpha-glucanotransferase [Arthrobacter sp. V1I7]|uniref:4-alpha-glucanotransferase n=1 Tax=Arthrobacter sp. V1I7 TaxID=3042274 RepID=UPI00278AFE3D|nr:4-alpha-glucanotransferase [Arthrobacter sp. V1I7]MDQ0821069.1 4-alpha-glucanotransferase [Arthrobacter sp. V1I7]